MVRGFHFGVGPEETYLKSFVVKLVIDTYKIREAVIRESKSPAGILEGITQGFTQGLIGIGIRNGIHIGTGYDFVRRIVDKFLYFGNFGLALVVSRMQAVVDIAYIIAYSLCKTESIAAVKAYTHGIEMKVEQAYGIVANYKIVVNAFVHVMFAILYGCRLQRTELRKSNHPENTLKFIFIHRIHVKIAVIAYAQDRVERIIVIVEVAVVKLLQTQYIRWAVITEPVKQVCIVITVALFILHALRVKGSYIITHYGKIEIGIIAAAVKIYRFAYGFYRNKQQQQGRTPVIPPARKNKRKRYQQKVQQ